MSTDAPPPPRPPQGAAVIDVNGEWFALPGNLARAWHAEHSARESIFRIFLVDVNIFEYQKWILRKILSQTLHHRRNVCDISLFL